jgi:hypothetical protein
VNQVMHKISLKNYVWVAKTLLLLFRHYKMYFSLYSIFLLNFDSNYKYCTLKYYRYLIFAVFDFNLAQKTWNFFFFFFFFFLNKNFKIKLWIISFYKYCIYVIERIKILWQYFEEGNYPLKVWMSIVSDRALI